MKATCDFTMDGVSVKAGDEIKPVTFCADDLVILLAKGFVVKDEPEREPKAHKAHKPK